MPTYDEILSEIYELLRPVAKGRSLDEDTKLVADLDLDSLKVMDVMTEVEDRFDISVPLNSLPDIQTIGDLARELQKTVDEK